MVCNAQSPDFSKAKFAHDPALFIGKWEAKSGNNSFELIITKGSMPVDEELNIDMDLLLGEMIYKKNGVVTRHVKPNGHRVTFRVSPWNILNPLQVKYDLSDEERKMNGEGEFTINPQNHRKATWKLRIKKKSLIMGQRDDDWNKAGFDIPTELEWTKIE
jgi:hypothetical protein